MKINSTIERYDVKDLNNISALVININKKLEYLNRCADTLLHNIAIVEQSFNSPNMVRAKEEIRVYKTKFEQANIEMNELLKSVDDFVQKLNHAWRSWN